MCMYNFRYVATKVESVNSCIDLYVETMIYDAVKSQSNCQCWSNLDAIINSLSLFNSAEAE